MGRESDTKPGRLLAWRICTCRSTRGRKLFKEAQHHPRCNTRRLQRVHRFRVGLLLGLARISGMSQQNRHTGEHGAEVPQYQCGKAAQHGRLHQQAHSMAALQMAQFMGKHAHHNVFFTRQQGDKFIRQNNRPPGQRQCIRANATLAEHQLPGWAAIRRQGACHLRERH